MQAVEFDATVDDGLIKIPANVKLRQRERAHVIVLYQDSEGVEKKTGMTAFTSRGISTCGFKFDRDIANER